MNILLQDELPFTAIRLAYQGYEVEIPNILIDTGSATTLLSADWLAKVGIHPQAQDTLHTIRGVGGVEIVFTRKVDYLSIGNKRIEDFEIEVGGMDYGFDIYGILGMNFLLQAGAIVNLSTLDLEFA